MMNILFRTFVFAPFILSKMLYFRSSKIVQHEFIIMYTYNYISPLQVTFFNSEDSNISTWLLYNNPKDMLPPFYFYLFIDVLYVKSRLYNLRSPIKVPFP
jgi:hypothetical protein